MTAVPGTTFAGYPIEAEIGRGGMGVVYRATDARLERPVALKLIAPELAEDPQFRERFLRESRLAAALDHGNVVPIYEAGEQNGQLFLAMRYVEGNDLETVIGEQGKLPPEQALSILGRVADALDAAHAKGLVHRDVKPGNVLLDERGHPYLTDFGLTKEAGSASTQTGHIVGTLDYLAPEQIRGEEVDGRTDQYALACLLYECLSGKPPFRRSTEAEVLWAHMQEEPPSLRDNPALDPVLARGLAKDKADRYPSCGELLAAAHSAVGLEPPALRRRRRRYGATLLIAGAALLVAVGVAVAVIELTGGESSALATPLPNSLVEVDPSSNKVVARISVGDNPTTLAVANNAIWVLNGDDQTIARIDPSSRLPRTFGGGTLPTDLAVGAGAVWVANSENTAMFPSPVVASVSRIDPETFEVRGRTRLRPRGEGGFPEDSLVVGKDAVWVINPDRSVSRIDPQTGAVVATVRSTLIDNITIDWRGTVWGISFSPQRAVVRIDPRTNNVTAKIRIPSQDLGDIAVGAGAVWVTSPEDGTVWRIDQGPPVRERTVPVAKGVDKIAFGEGSVWAVNPVHGTLDRIDPATNLVSKTIQLQGTPRDIAVGEGRVWVSDAGATCRDVVFGGNGEPDYLLVSDLPLRNSDVVPALAMSRAIELVFRQRGFHAGKYRVGYQSCDDSASIGVFDVPKCAANAKSFVAGASVIGVIGTYNSGCAFNEIPLLNLAPDGPLAMVSPSNSYIGLTRNDPTAPPGQLASLYPTGVRNYARVYPTDDAQGAAAAIFLRSLGVEKAFLLNDPQVLGYGDPMLRSFRAATRTEGPEVVGSAAWDASRPKSYPALVDRVQRSGADGVFLAGLLGDNGDKLLKKLRSRLPQAKIVLPDGFLPIADLFAAVGAHLARSLYVSFPGLTNERLPPAGRRFVDTFGATQPGHFVHPMTVFAAQAAEVLLDAVARSDGTRASVTKELLATRVEHGILGTFGFDRNGDTTAQRVTILRPSRAGGSRVMGSNTGGSVVSVIDVPPSLLP